MCLTHSDQDEPPREAKHSALGNGIHRERQEALQRIKHRTLSPPPTSTQIYIWSGHNSEDNSVRVSSTMRMSLPICGARNSSNRTNYHGKDLDARGLDHGSTEVELGEVSDWYGR